MKIEIENHGIAELDFVSIFTFLESCKPKYRSEWDPDYWISNRDKLETGAQALYSKESSMYYQYADDGLNAFVPDSLIKQHHIKTDFMETKVFKYAPGSFMPPHVDRYNSLRAKFGLDDFGKEKIIRLWIALQEPMFGHGLFFEDGQAMTGMPKGTVLTWTYGARHSACNAGLDERYIMTVTCVIDDKSK